MSRRRPRAGVALILALLVVTILTITVVPFVYDGRVEQAVAGNLYTSLQASYLAGGGVAFAEAALRFDARLDQGAKPPLDHTGELWGKLAAFPIPAAGGAAHVVIADEAGKFPLNAVGRAQGISRDAWRDRLVQLLVYVAKIDDTEARGLASTLRDWVDGDSQEEPGGAERTHYAGQDRPDDPPNRPLQTVQELRLVAGWTPKVVEAVAPFVTVYPETGQQVNPNTAPPEVLVALGLEPRQAEDVVVDRDTYPFQNASNLAARTPFNDQNFNQVFAFRSNYFSVTSTGSFRDSTYIIRTVLRREGSRIDRLYWRAE
jgi:general secretion pathway protein K